MAGVSRSGFQALVNAVWSLGAIASRTARGVKTVQHGTISFGTDEASHSSTLGVAVDTTRSVITPLGAEVSENRQESTTFRLAFGSSTQVTGTRGLVGGATGASATVGYTVTEYY
jgi:hypothetical protein